MRPALVLQSGLGSHPEIPASRTQPSESMASPMKWVNESHLAGPMCETQQALFVGCFCLQAKRRLTGRGSGVPAPWGHLPRDLVLRGRCGLSGCHSFLSLSVLTRRASPTSPSFSSRAVSAPPHRPRHLHPAPGPPGHIRFPAAQICLFPPSTPGEATLPVASGSTWQCQPAALGCPWPSRMTGVAPA